MIARTSAFVLCTCLSLAVAQAPLTFDVASIKPNNSGSIAQSVRFYPPSGRVTITNGTLKGLMLQAFQLQESQLVGGPGWIASDHFDIVANSEQENLSPQQRWLMIKALIVDRFKLKVHTESREQSVFALVLSRKDGALGEHLHKSSTDCANMRPPTAPPPAFDPAHPPPCGVIMGGPGQMTLRGVPIEWVTKQLAARVGRAVIDGTGLTGYFDLDLEFTPQARVGDAADPAADRPADPGASIYTALQEQLGLKLESQKHAVDVLVIDSAEHPTEG
jgi:uncharacterized protein (TIGR03435 family)